MKTKRPPAETPGGLTWHYLRMKTLACPAPTQNHCRTGAFGDIRNLLSHLEPISQRRLGRQLETNMLFAVFVFSLNPDTQYRPGISLLPISLMCHCGRIFLLRVLWENYNEPSSESAFPNPELNATLPPSLCPERRLCIRSLSSKASKNQNRRHTRPVFRRESYPACKARPN